MRLGISEATMLRTTLNLTFSGYLLLKDDIIT
jgi:DNA-binding MurR/RpiR family transcriptional regulator